MARKNPLIKRAHQQEEYTPDLVQELLRCSHDPAYFIEKYVKIQHPVLGTIDFELYPYQRKLIKNFHNHQFNIILSARQTGKALALDTPIPTPDGWTTMEELKVGDYILDATGNKTKITFVTETMYDHNCYKVQFSNNESIVADEDHLWEVNDTFTKKVVVKTTKQLICDGYGVRPSGRTCSGRTCRYSINNTKPLQLKESELLIDPYILGCWLGDGTSSRGEFYCSSG